MNDSMVFYRSFYEAIRLLPPELRLQAYDTILAYGIDEIEPEELDAYVEMVYTLIKPQVDANSRRRSNGGKGGRPSHNEYKIDETIGFENGKPLVIESENHRLSETETDGYADEKPNVNVNANVNVNVKDNDKGVGEPKRTRFVPPSIADVKNYSDANGLNVDAERFVDFYSSKGWTVGKSPMKDWKAAARNWDRAAPAKKPGFTAMTGRDNSGKYSQLEAALLGRATG